MAKNKSLKSNIGDLTGDLLAESFDHDLADKKVNVFITDEKAKTKDQYVIMFVENVLSLLQDNKLTMTELKVLLALVKFSQFKNVFKVTQQAIASYLEIDKAVVSRVFKKLYEKEYLLKDENGLEYVNPYLFYKGKLLEFKASQMHKQLSLHFDDKHEIKNPF